jgi:hypothetical protein
VDDNGKLTRSGQISGTMDGSFTRTAAKAANGDVTGSFGRTGTNSDTFMPAASAAPGRNFSAVHTATGTFTRTPLKLPSGEVGWDSTRNSQSVFDITPASGPARAGSASHTGSSRTIITLEPNGVEKLDLMAQGSTTVFRPGEAPRPSSSTTTRTATITPMSPTPSP